MIDQQQFNQSMDNIGFREIPPNINQNVWTEHLDVNSIIDYIDNLLKGNELDENGEWKPTYIEILDNKGKPKNVKTPSLMSDTDRRVLITWFRTHLNSNTFLSKLDREMINNIGWETNIRLAKVFYVLRNKINPHIRDLLWSSLDNAIYIGLNRAGEGRRGMTLEAVSSSHHTIENLQGNTPNQAQQDKKQFKVFGF